jgi:hypothetical protein
MTGEVDLDNPVKEFADWVGRHPEVIVGTAIVVGGAVIIISGGSAAPLMFAAF